MARPADLLPVEEARARILERFSRLAMEEVHLDEARGRFLAERVLASVNLPPFANSSMDGFAVRSEATTGATAGHAVVLSVSMHIPAGAVGDQVLGKGEAARIMTGAPLPDGADAVTPFEEIDDRGNQIFLSEPVTPGACVRPAGQDARIGDAVLEAGTELQAPQLALIAALGHRLVHAVRRPRVAVLSTGDELVQPGEPIGPGQIYESNTPMLVAAVEEAGAVAIRAHLVRDDAAAIEEALRETNEPDMLLTSGGASVGDFDQMKSVVGTGGEIAFWRVRVRPGKPLLFGCFGDVPIIGLPGNPTSAMVTFEEFARPAIRKMLGAPLMRPEIEAVADERIDNRGGRRTYARVRLEWRDEEWHARLAGGQDSAMLVPLAHADGLLEISEEKEEVRVGERARVQVWNLPVG